MTARSPTFFSPDRENTMKFVDTFTQEYCETKSKEYLDEINHLKRKVFVLEQMPNPDRNCIKRVLKQIDELRDKREVFDAILYR